MPIKKTEISYKVDLKRELDERNVKPHRRKEATRVAGEEALKNVLSYTESQRSSVTGGKWVALTEKYRKLKRERGKGGKANLRLDGDMLSSLKVDSTRSSFTLKIVDPLEKKKANNHNTIQDSVNKLPQRQFLPNDSEGKDEKFEGKIIDRYEKKLDKYKEDKPFVPAGEALPLSVEIRINMADLTPDLGAWKPPVIFKQTPKETKELLSEWTSLKKSILKDKSFFK